jgi:hypothetical protein
VEKRWDFSIWICWNAEIHEGIETNSFSRFNCHECVIPRTTIVYIPSFVKGKWEEEIIYDLEACEELLKDTYGLLFIKNRWCFIPKLADFSKVMPMFYVKRWEEAKDVLDKMKPKL